MVDCWLASLLLLWVMEMGSIDSIDLGASSCLVSSRLVADLCDGYCRVDVFDMADTTIPT